MKQHQKQLTFLLSGLLIVLALYVFYPKLFPSREMSDSQSQFGTVPEGPRDVRKANDNATFRKTSPSIGEALPDLSGYDEQGNEFSLDELKGHLTVLVFGCLT